MPLRFQRSLFALALVALVSVAYEPLLSPGFFGDDFRVLVEASGEGTTGREVRPLAEAFPEDLYRLGGEGGSILTGLWTAGSRRFWRVDRGGQLGAGHAVAYRIENFAMLLLGAVGLGFFVRRLLLPWTGTEQARAAGRTAMALFAVHPLCTTTVASLSTRSVLLGLTLSAWSAWAFLRGRQERLPGWTAASCGLAVAAGLAGEISISLPFLLAATELSSAHRYRPARVRRRTALNTFLVFLACVAVDPILRRILLGSAAAPAVFRTLGESNGFRDFSELIMLFVEKLGVLVLPVNLYGSGVLGLGIAGALFLLALQPAMQAGRSAPRLWGWLLVAWFCALAFTGLSGALERVTNRDLSNAHVLFASAAVMSVGLAVAVTAVSDWRRRIFASCLVVGYALLSHANSLPWKRAWQEMLGLRQDIYATHQIYGADVQVLVIDPPEYIEGVHCLEGALPWIVDPVFRAEPSSGQPRPIQGLTRGAFLALACEPEFAILREQGLVLLVPPDSIEGLQPAADEVDGATGEPPSGDSEWIRRLSFYVGPSEPGSGPLAWRGGPQSPSVDLDVWRVTALEAVAGPAEDTRRSQVLSWSAREVQVPGGELPGAWVGAGPAPVALFDLSSSLAWRLGGRATQLWFEDGMLGLEQASLLAELPQLLEGDGPGAEHGDWLFQMSAPEGVQIELELLDLVTLEHARFVGRLEPSQVRFPAAGELVEGVLEGSGGPIVWRLEALREGCAVARSSGRFQLP